jgi:epoxyqueuosine reductase
VNDPIESRLKTRAYELGFCLAGIARAEPADRFDEYRDWIAEGHHGEMAYLEKRAGARRHPESILPEVRSIVMLAMAHDRREATHAKVAKYALAVDYHEYIWQRLNELAQWLSAELPVSQSRGVSDTAPLLERGFARRAGLGWIGKNAMLIDKKHGSFLMLGALLTTADLQADTPFEMRHCGTCTACLDACPTDAFVRPHVLDARKCISYLTIELKSAIPVEQRAGVGEWLFGCDVCQDVCPWNRRKNHAPGLPLSDVALAINPFELLSMSPTEFRKRYRGTPFLRANWRGLLRNAAIVLGNRRNPVDLPALQAALQWDDPIVREAVEWAIEQYRES